MQKEINKQKVPNQRVISIHKQLCDKEHKFTVNNLQALDQAATRLTQKASFKLYMYIAKNQDKYSFNLSSKDFMKWANVGYTSYTTAFKQLVDQGYLIKKEGTKDIYTFYDKSQTKNDIKIEYAKDKVDEIRKIKEHVSISQFIF